MGLPQYGHNLEECEYKVWGIALVKAKQCMEHIDRSFAVPYNGDPMLADKIEEAGLSQNVYELYGTDGNFASGRKVEATTDAFFALIRKLRDRDIEFNYLLNAINCDDYIIRNSELFDLLWKLKDAGVNIITVSHPIIARSILEKGFSFQINSSVNQFVNSLAKAQALERIGYSRITIDEDYLRNLKVISDIKKNVAADIEILINNGCHNGCINRITHQALLSSVHPELSDSLRRQKIQQLRSTCSRLFRSSFLRFLEGNWIRPEDLWRYRKAGAKVFKLSGRTFTTQAIIKSLAAYSSGEYNGNVLDYIKPDISSADRFGFSYLASSDVTVYFDHIWNGCKRARDCQICPTIANNLAVKIGFQGLSNEH